MPKLLTGGKESKVQSPKFKVQTAGSQTGDGAKTAREEMGGLIDEVKPKVLRERLLKA